MLKQKDVVIYGNSGICRIIDIREEDFMGKKKTYYILKPLYEDKTTIHVPTFNERLASKMKPTLKKAELLSLINSLNEIESVWIDNDKLRHEKYREGLDNGDRNAIVSIIKALTLRRDELSKNGKKLRFTDEQCLNDAERIFEGECAYVLGIERNEVQNFICECNNLTKQL